jgi:hypothetical protein
MFDVTNLYIVQGLQGGLLQITVFIALIAVAFRTAGRVWRAQASRDRLILAWAVATALLVHATSFLAVSYFGQIWMNWYLVLGMIGSMDPGRQALTSGAALPTRRVLRSGQPTLPSGQRLPALVRNR